EVRREPRDEHDIDRAVADDLIRDVDVARLRLLRLRRFYPAHDVTAKTRQRSGTPLSSCSPRSSNVIPEPATMPFSVSETRTSRGPARCPTRDAMWTAMPPMSAPIRSISP